MNITSFQEWDWGGFWNGFVSLSYQMRYDGLIMVFLIPTIIGLYVISKNNRYANSVSIMISGVIISNPILLITVDTIVFFVNSFLSFIYLAHIAIR